MSRLLLRPPSWGLFFALVLLQVLLVARPVLAQSVYDPAGVLGLTITDLLSGILLGLLVLVYAAGVAVGQQR